MLYKHITIDTNKNRLLCSSNLVGLGELVEIFSLDNETPPQASGKTLKKTSEPNVFFDYSNGSTDSHSKMYFVGNECILRVVARNRSGMLRRKTPEEKLIVNMEVIDPQKESKIIRAKTGSVRKKEKKEHPLKLHKKRKK